MQYDESPFGHLEARRAYLAAQQENTGRTARVATTWTTVGSGEAVTTKAFDFGIRFIEEPCFTAGMALDETTRLQSGYYPRVNAGVYEWKKDNHDYYTGALIFFTIDTYGAGSISGEQPNYVIHHHLRFEGKALKDIPAHLLDF